MKPLSVNVQRKYVRTNTKLPPCCGDYWYSTDNGETWVIEHDYKKYVEQFVKQFFPSVKKINVEMYC